jgi:hypothetical protein
MRDEIQTFHFELLSRWNFDKPSWSLSSSVLLSKLVESAAFAHVLAAPKWSYKLKKAVSTKERTLTSFSSS